MHRQPGRRRALSATLAVALFCSSVPLPSAAAAALKPLPPGADSAAASFNLAALDVSSFSVPRRIGRVVERWQPDDRVPARLVIHVQDLHVRHGAQLALVQLIDQLSRSVRVSLVALEGGVGPGDTEFFSAFPDAQANRHLARFFLEQGLFTGPVFYAVTHPGKVELFGVEDTAVFLDHLENYQDAHPKQLEAAERIAMLSGVLTALRDALFSEELTALTSQAAAFQEGTLGLTEYVRSLEQMAAGHKLPLDGYPNLSRLLRVMRLEAQLDTAAVESEHRQLAELLSRELSDADLQAFLAHQMSLTSGRLSHAQYYQGLQSFAEKAGIQLGTPASDDAGYANLSTYSDVLLLSARLRPEQLPAELDRLVNAVKERLFTTTDQRQLDALMDALQVIEDLYHVRLTRSGLDGYRFDHAAFRARPFVTFLHRHQRLTPELREAITNLFADLSIQERFYDIALQRDEALVANTLRAMEERDEPVAILVAGGFHTQGITEGLKKQGAAYVVITPSVLAAREQQDNAKYVALLHHQVPPVEDVISGFLEKVARDGLRPSKPWTVAALQSTLRTEPALSNVTVEAIGEGQVQIIVNGLVATLESRKTALNPPIGVVSTLSSDLPAFESRQPPVFVGRTDEDQEPPRVLSQKEYREASYAPSNIGMLLGSPDAEMGLTAVEHPPGAAQFPSRGPEDRAGATLGGIQAAFEALPGADPAAQYHAIQFLSDTGMGTVVEQAVQQWGPSQVEVLGQLGVPEEWLSSLGEFIQANTFTGAARFITEARDNTLSTDGLALLVVLHYGLEFTLSGMNPPDAAVIRARFFERPQPSLEEVGQRIGGVTEKRVYDRQQLSLRTLRRTTGLLRIIEEMNSEQPQAVEMELLGIESLGLPLRISQLLHQARISTISALTAKSRQELLRISDLGQTSVIAIEQALAARGLQLRDASVAPEPFSFPSFDRAGASLGGRWGRRGRRDGLDILRAEGALDTIISRRGGQVASPLREYLIPELTRIVGRAELRALLSADQIAGARARVQQARTGYQGLADLEEAIRQAVGSERFDALRQKVTDFIDSTPRDSTWVSHLLPMFETLLLEMVPDDVIVYRVEPADSWGVPTAEEGLASEWGIGTAGLRQALLTQRADTYGVRSLRVGWATFGELRRNGAVVSIGGGRVGQDVVKLAHRNRRAAVDVQPIRWDDATLAEVLDELDGVDTDFWILAAIRRLTAQLPLSAIRRGTIADAAGVSDDALRESERTNPRVAAAIRNVFGGEPDRAGATIAGVREVEQLAVDLHGRVLAAIDQQVAIALSEAAETRQVSEATQALQAMLSGSLEKWTGDVSADVLAGLDAEQQEELQAFFAGRITQEERDRAMESLIALAEQHPETVYQQLRYQYEPLTPGERDVLIRRYEQALGTEPVEVFRLLADELIRQDITIVDMNTTTDGGGVAEILRSAVPLLDALGVKILWQLLVISDPLFPVGTKFIHNALQDFDQPPVDWARYNKVQEQNGRLYANLYRRSGYAYFIHDPQLPRQIPVIQAMNPAAKIIARLHVDTSGTDVDGPGVAAWNALSPYWDLADIFLHQPGHGPRGGVAPLRTKTLTLAASINTLAEKNVPRASETEALEVLAGMRDDIGRELMTDGDRSRWMVVARPDPHKGQVPALLGFIQYLKNTDPDGVQWYTLQFASDDPESYSQYLMLKYLIVDEPAQREQLAAQLEEAYGRIDMTPEQIARTLGVLEAASDRIGREMADVPSGDEVPAGTPLNSRVQVITTASKELGDLATVADGHLVLSNHEGRGLVPDEMARHKLPIVATNVPAFLDRVIPGERGGWLVDLKPHIAKMDPIEILEGFVNEDPDVLAYRDEIAQRMGQIHANPGEARAAAEAFNDWVLENELLANQGNRMALLLAQPDELEGAESAADVKALVVARLRADRAAPDTGVFVYHDVQYATKSERDVAIILLHFNILDAIDQGTTWQITAADAIQDRGVIPGELVQILTGRGITATDADIAAIQDAITQADATVPDRAGATLGGARGGAFYAVNHANLNYPAAEEETIQQLLDAEAVTFDVDDEGTWAIQTSPGQVALYQLLGVEPGPQERALLEQLRDVTSARAEELGVSPDRQLAGGRYTIYFGDSEHPIAGTESDFDTPYGPDLPGDEYSVSLMHLMQFPDHALRRSDFVLGLTNKAQYKITGQGPALTGRLARQDADILVTGQIGEATVTDSPDRFRDRFVGTLDQRASWVFRATQYAEAVHALRDLDARQQTATDPDTVFQELLELDAGLTVETAMDIYIQAVADYGIDRGDSDAKGIYRAVDPNELLSEPGNWNDIWNNRLVPVLGSLELLGLGKKLDADIRNDLVTVGPHVFAMYYLTEQLLTGALAPRDAKRLFDQARSGGAQESDRAGASLGGAQDPYAELNLPVRQMVDRIIADLLAGKPPSGKMEPLMQRAMARIFLAPGPQTIDEVRTGLINAGLEAGLVRAIVFQSYQLSTTISKERGPAYTRLTLDIRSQIDNFQLHGLIVSELMAQVVLGELRPSLAREYISYIISASTDLQPSEALSLAESYVQEAVRLAPADRAGATLGGRDPTVAALLSRFRSRGDQLVENGLSIFDTWEPEDLTGSDLRFSRSLMLLTDAADESDLIPGEDSSLLEIRVNNPDPGKTDLPLTLVIRDGALRRVLLLGMIDLSPQLAPERYRQKLEVLVQRLGRELMTLRIAAAGRQRDSAIVLKTYDENRFRQSLEENTRLRRLFALLPTFAIDARLFLVREAEGFDPSLLVVEGTTEFGTGYVTFDEDTNYGHEGWHAWYDGLLEPERDDELQAVNNRWLSARYQQVHEWLASQPAYEGTQENEAWLATETLAFVGTSYLEGEDTFMGDGRVVYTLDEDDKAYFEDLLGEGAAGSDRAGATLGGASGFRLPSFITAVETVEPSLSGRIRDLIASSMAQLGDRLEMDFTPVLDVFDDVVARGNFFWGDGLGGTGWNTVQGNQPYVLTDGALRDEFNALLRQRGVSRDSAEFGKWEEALALRLANTILQELHELYLKDRGEIQVLVDRFGYDREELTGAVGRLNLTYFEASGQLLEAMFFNMLDSTLDDDLDRRETWELMQQILERHETSYDGTGWAVDFWYYLQFHYMGIADAGVEPTVDFIDHVDRRAIGSETDLMVQEFWRAVYEDPYEIARYQQLYPASPERVLDVRQDTTADAFAVAVDIIRAIYSRAPTEPGASLSDRAGATLTGAPEPYTELSAPDREFLDQAAAQLDGAAPSAESPYAKLSAPVRALIDLVAAQTFDEAVPSAELVLQVRQAMARIFQAPGSLTMVEVRLSLLDAGVEETRVRSVISQAFLLNSHVSKELGPAYFRVGPQTRAQIDRFAANRIPIAELMAQLVLEELSPVLAREFISSSITGASTLEPSEALFTAEILVDRAIQLRPGDRAGASLGGAEEEPEATEEPTIELVLGTPQERNAADDVPSIGLSVRQYEGEGGILNYVNIDPLFGGGFADQDVFERYFSNLRKQSSPDDDVILETFLNGRYGLRFRKALAKVGIEEVVLDLISPDAWDDYDYAFAVRNVLRRDESLYISIPASEGEHVVVDWVLFSMKRIWETRWGHDAFVTEGLVYPQEEMPIPVLSAPQVPAFFSLLELLRVTEALPAAVIARIARDTYPYVSELQAMASDLDMRNLTEALWASLPEKAGDPIAMTLGDRTTGAAYEIKTNVNRPDFRLLSSDVQDYVQRLRQPNGIHLSYALSAGRRDTPPVLLIDVSSVFEHQIASMLGQRQGDDLRDAAERVRYKANGLNDLVTRLLRDAAEHDLLTFTDQGAAFVDPEEMTIEGPKELPPQDRAGASLGGASISLADANRASIQALTRLEELWSLRVTPGFLLFDETGQLGLLPSPEQALEFLQSHHNAVIAFRFRGRPLSEFDSDEETFLKFLAHEINQVSVAYLHEFTPDEWGREDAAGVRQVVSEVSRFVASLQMLPEAGLPLSTLLDVPAFDIAGRSMKNELGRALDYVQHAIDVTRWQAVSDREVRVAKREVDIAVNVLENLLERSDLAADDVFRVTMESLLPVAREIAQLLDQRVRAQQTEVLLGEVDESALDAFGTLIGEDAGLPVLSREDESLFERNSEAFRLNASAELADAAPWNYQVTFVLDSLQDAYIEFKDVPFTLINRRTGERILAQFVNEPGFDSWSVTVFDLPPGTYRIEAGDQRISESSSTDDRAGASLGGMTLADANRASVQALEYLDELARIGVTTGLLLLDDTDQLGHLRSPEQALEFLKTHEHAVVAFRFHPARRQGDLIAEFDSNREEFLRNLIEGIRQATVIYVHEFTPDEWGREEAAGARAVVGEVANFVAIMQKLSEAGLPLNGLLDVPGYDFADQTPDSDDRERQLLRALELMERAQVITQGRAVSYAEMRFTKRLIDRAVIELELLLQPSAPGVDVTLRDKVIPLLPIAKSLAENIDERVKAQRTVIPIGELDVRALAAFDTLIGVDAEVTLTSAEEEISFARATEVFSLSALASLSDAPPWNYDLDFLMESEMNVPIGNENMPFTLTNLRTGEQILAQLVKMPEEEDIWEVTVFDLPPGTYRIEAGDQRISEDTTNADRAGATLSGAEDVIERLEFEPENLTRYRELLIEAGGIRTISELTRRSRQDLLAIEGFDDEMVTAIQQTLARRRLRLRDEDAQPATGPLFRDEVLELGSREAPTTVGLITIDALRDSELGDEVIDLFRQLRQHRGVDTPDHSSIRWIVYDPGATDQRSAAAHVRELDPNLTAHISAYLVGSNEFELPAQLGDLGMGDLRGLPISLVVGTGRQVNRIGDASRVSSTFFSTDRVSVDIDPPRSASSGNLALALNSLIRHRRDRLEGFPQIPESVTRIGDVVVHMADGLHGRSPLSLVDYYVAIRGDITVAEVYGRLLLRVQEIADSEGLGDAALLIERYIDMDARTILLDATQEHRSLPLSSYDEEARILETHFPGYAVRGTWWVLRDVLLLQQLYDARLTGVRLFDDAGDININIAADPETGTVQLEGRAVTLDEIMAGATTMEADRREQGLPIGLLDYGDEHTFPFGIGEVSLQGTVPDRAGASLGGAEEPVSDDTKILAAIGRLQTEASPDAIASWVSIAVEADMTIRRLTQSATANPTVNAAIEAALRGTSQDPEISDAIEAAMLVETSPPDAETSESTPSGRARTPRAPVTMVPLPVAAPDDVAALEAAIARGEYDQYVARRRTGARGGLVQHMPSETNEVFLSAIKGGSKAAAETYAGFWEHLVHYLVPELQEDLEILLWNLSDQQWNPTWEREDFESAAHLGILREIARMTRRDSVPSGFARQMSARMQGSVRNAIFEEAANSLGVPTSLLEELHQAFRGIEQQPLRDITEAWPELRKTMQDTHPDLMEELRLIVTTSGDAAFSPEDLGDDPTAERAMRAGSREVVRQAIQSIQRPQHRDQLIMHYGFDLSFQEIADVFGLHRSGIHTRLNSDLRRLRHPTRSRPLRPLVDGIGATTDEFIPGIEYAALLTDESLSMLERRMRVDVRTREKILTNLVNVRPSQTPAQAIAALPVARDRDIARRLLATAEPEPGPTEDRAGASPTGLQTQPQAGAGIGASPITDVRQLLEPVRAHQRRVEPVMQEALGVLRELDRGLIYLVGTGMLETAAGVAALEMVSQQPNAAVALIHTDDDPSLPEFLEALGSLGLKMDRVVDVSVDATTQGTAEMTRLILEAANEKFEANGVQSVEDLNARNTVTIATNAPDEAIEQGGTQESWYLRRLVTDEGAIHIVVQRPQDGEDADAGGVANPAAAVAGAAAALSDLETLPPGVPPDVAQAVADAKRAIAEGRRVHIPLMPDPDGVLGDIESAYQTQLAVAISN